MKTIYTSIVALAAVLAPAYMVAAGQYGYNQKGPMDTYGTQGAEDNMFGGYGSQNRSGWQGAEQGRGQRAGDMGQAQNQHEYATQGRGQYGYGRPQNAMNGWGQQQPRSSTYRMSDLFGY